MKRCSKCGIEKGRSNFYKNKHKKDGLNNWCIECLKQYKKENKEKILEQNGQYYEENKEKISKKQRRWYNAFKNETGVIYLLHCPD